MTQKSARRGKGNHHLRYIPCRVVPGMFRDEWLVYLEAADPKDPDQTITVQLLVDQRDVTGLRGIPTKDTPVEGKLRVTLASTNKGFAQVVLPQPAVPVGDSMLIEEERVLQET